MFIAIMTQGSPKEDKWVTSYILSYLNEFKNTALNRWTNYTDENGSVKVSHAHQPINKRVFSPYLML